MELFSMPIESDALRHVCPACGAKPWIPCLRPGERPNEMGVHRTHAARIALEQEWRAHVARCEAKWGEIGRVA